MNTGQMPDLSHYNHFKNEKLNYIVLTDIKINRESFTSAENDCKRFSNGDKRLQNR